uniref:Ulp1 protease family, C-terminal catalytic domain-containing protein n=1 Tax=Tanacetum cinerariifolium TaxID=118510 RepID=A0A6L2N0T3_TANCI|nr:ulp1 protease family, C-terminal catalytic domain-containing protein [Tanacetum cinerariifolium]
MNGSRSIVIQRRVEDLQLGVESYQKKLNLPKPDTYRTDLKRKEAYTAYSNPRGLIYQNKDKQNKLMRIDELHKFRDDMLNDVQTALDDRLKGIRMKYLPQTIWRRSDKERAATMIQAINKQLKTRRIMRSRSSRIRRTLKDGGEGTCFQLSQRFIAACSYPTIKYKDIMIAQKALVEMNEESITRETNSLSTHACIDRKKLDNDNFPRESIRFKCSSQVVVGQLIFWAGHERHGLRIVLSLLKGLDVKDSTFLQDDQGRDKCMEQHNRMCGDTEDGTFVDMVVGKICPKMNRMSVDDEDGVLDSQSDDEDGVLDSQTKDVIEEASMLPTMLSSSSAHPRNDEDVSHLDDNMEIDGPNAKDHYSNSLHHFHLLIKALGTKIENMSIDLVVVVPPKVDDPMLRTIKPKDDFDEANVYSYDDDYMSLFNDEEQPAKSSLNNLELQQEPDIVDVKDGILEQQANVNKGKTTVIQETVRVTVEEQPSLGRVNKPKHHWCLAQLEIRTGVVTFYDSLGWAGGSRRCWWRRIKKNKRMSFFGVVQSDLDVFQQFLNHIISEIDKPKWALFYCKPKKSLENGLKLLHTDNDVYSFTDVAVKNGSINLYVAHKKQNLGKYYYKNMEWEKDDASLRCSSSTPFSTRVKTKISKRKKISVIHDEGDDRKKSLVTGGRKGKEKVIEDGGICRKGSKADVSIYKRAMVNGKAKMVEDIGAVKRGKERCVIIKDSGFSNDGGKETVVTKRAIGSRKMEGKSVKAKVAITLVHQLSYECGGCY